MQEIILGLKIEIRTSLAFRSAMQERDLDLYRQLNQASLNGTAPC